MVQGHPRSRRTARAFLVRHGSIEWVWIGIGAVFHLGLALTTELGIFPWAMLALYPAWVHPDDWSALLRRLTGETPR